MGTSGPEPSLAIRGLSRDGGVPAPHRAGLRRPTGSPGRANRRSRRNASHSRAAADRRTHGHGSSNPIANISANANAHTGSDGYSSSDTDANG